jgi:quinol monooxygenase YgiN
MKSPVNMHVTYRPKPGKAEELLALVLKHGPALENTGLMANGPASVYRATNKRTGEISFIELFSWRDEEAPNLAHQTPEVMSVWEPMTPLLENLDLAVIEKISGPK